LTAIMLIQILERQGFKLSIFGKSRLRLSFAFARTPGDCKRGYGELVEKTFADRRISSGQGAVQLASPQRRDEPTLIRAPGKPLTQQQLKFIDALTYANTIAQAGRIAGYGTRQAAHKAYNALLNRLPGSCGEHSRCGASARMDKTSECYSAFNNSLLLSAILQPVLPGARDWCT